MKKLFLSINTYQYLEMKNIIIVLCMALGPVIASAQTATRLPDVDKSPMDMIYFPANYPVLKIQNKASEPLVARVIYSRPQRQGRKIFGDLVEYGKIWRLGANEATEIEFYKDVRVGGKKIHKGRYTLYALVNETSWDIIFNKDTDTWGAFKYDAKKDVIRTEVAVQKTEELVDFFSMTFEKTDAGASLIIAWEQCRVSLPISF